MDVVARDVVCRKGDRAARRWRTKQARAQIWHLLYEERIRRNLSQQEAATFLNVKQSTYNAWENALNAPGYLHWPSLALFLHLGTPALGAEIGSTFFGNNTVYGDKNTFETI